MRDSCKIELPRNVQQTHRGLASWEYILSNCSRVRSASTIVDRSESGLGRATAPGSPLVRRKAIAITTSASWTASFAIFVEKRTLSRSRESCRTEDKVLI